MRLARLETLLEVKEASAETGAVAGYGSVYGNVDLGGDIVAAGAFAEAAKAYGPDAPLPMLWQHDASEPIGVWDALAEDERGLRVSGTVLKDTSRGRDALAFVRAKAVRGLSIGYRVVDADVDRASGVRTIRKAELWEVSVVTFPMNPEARVDGLKLAETAGDMTEREIERALRDAGFSARDAKAAVSRLMDLGASRDAARIREAVKLEQAVEAALRAIRG